MRGVGNLDCIEESLEFFVEEGIAWWKSIDNHLVKGATRAVALSDLITQ